MRLTEIWTGPRKEAEERLQLSVWSDKNTSTWSTTERCWLRGIPLWLWCVLPHGVKTEATSRLRAKPLILYLKPAVGSDSEGSGYTVKCEREAFHSSATPDLEQEELLEHLILTGQEVQTYWTVSQNDVII